MTYAECWDACAVELDQYGLSWNLTVECWRFHFEPGRTEDRLTWGLWISDRCVKLESKTGADLVARVRQWAAQNATSERDAVGEVALP